MKKSLKREFNISIILVNLFITILLGISLGYLLYQNETNNVKTILRLENEAIANSINGYFKKFQIVIDFLSELEKVRKGYKLSSRERRISKALSPFRKARSGYKLPILRLFY
jgi:hypothetical protein